MENDLVPETFPQKQESPSVPSIKINKINPIDFINHLIGLMVVFLGVTAGFLLNNWREDRLENKSVINYMNGFYSDLESNEKELNDILKNAGKKMELFKSCLNKLRNNSFLTDSSAIILSEMLTITLFIPQTITYDNIKNSGNLGMITDFDLRNNIISYYKGLDELKLTEKYYTDYVDHYIIPFVYSNMEMAEGKMVNMKSLESPQFRNLISGYYALLQQNYKEYEKIKEENKNLRMQLEGQIK